MRPSRPSRLICGGVLSGALASCAPPHTALQDGAVASSLPSAPKQLALVRPGAAGGREAAPLLSFLSDELERNAKELGKAKDRDRVPYFIEYEATDEHTVQVEGSFGTLVTSTDDRSRSLDVDVRVGTSKLDNTHRLRGDYDVSRDFT